MYWHEKINYFLIERSSRGSEKSKHTGDLLGGKYVGAVLIHNDGVSIGQHVREPLKKLVIFIGLILKYSLAFLPDLFIKKGRLAKVWHLRQTYLKKKENYKSGKSLAFLPDLAEKKI